MEVIIIKYTVSSKFTGQTVDDGRRIIRLIDKRKSAKDHQRDMLTFLRNLWTPAAYEISVNWMPI